MSGCILPDRASLDYPNDRPVLLYAYAANLRKLKEFSFKTKTRLRIAKTIISMKIPETGKTRIFSCFTTTEKSLKSTI